MFILLVKISSKSFTLLLISVKPTVTKIKSSFINNIQRKGQIGKEAEKYNGKLNSAVLP